MLLIDESFGERRASQVRRQGNGELQPLDSLRGDVRDHTVQKDSTHAVYIEGSRTTRSRCPDPRLAAVGCGSDRRGRLSRLTQAYFCQPVPASHVLVGGVSEGIA
ncbi:hypothetical protein [Microbacterium lacticum]